MLEGLSFLAVLLFGFGAGHTYKTEKVKQEQKIECQAKCNKK